MMFRGKLILSDISAIVLYQTMWGLKDDHDDNDENGDDGNEDEDDDDDNDDNYLKALMSVLSLDVTLRRLL